MTSVPQADRARPAVRVQRYLSEMFPLSRRVPEALLLYAGLTTLLARAHGRETAIVSPATARGALAAFLFMLALRLMDELKDVETDRALFPERALPSGRVHEKDIGRVLAFVAPAFALLHLGAGAAWLTSLGALGYALLMFRWFFIPERMRPSLPLTLATHTPVTAFLVVHLSVLWAESEGIGAAALRARPVGLIAIAYWAAVFGWEIARKIRAPEGETAYVTYSRLLGLRGAVALAAGAQTLSIAAGLSLIAFHGARGWSAVPLLAGALVAAIGHLRFLRRPDVHTQALRPFAEGQFAGLLFFGLSA